MSQGLHPLDGIFGGSSLQPQKDRAWVKRLVDALTAEGWEVWWDLNIRSGETFDRAIERTLQGVRCVVAVWSEHSVDSDWVRAESGWAKDRGRLVSIRIDENLELPLKFYYVHTESMVGWRSSRKAAKFRKLAEDITKLAGSPTSTPSPTEVTEPPPAKKQTARRVRKARPRQSAQPKRPQQPIKPTSPSKPAGTVYRDRLKGGGESPEMVIIPAGSFMMGSLQDEADRLDNEGPKHEVTIAQPFALGKYPVTFDEYDCFCEAIGRTKPVDSGWGRGNRPVINVSWEDAVAYWPFAPTPPEKVKIRRR